MPKLVWTSKAVKQLIKIDTRYQSAIKSKVDKLVDFPLIEGLDVTALKGYSKTYRLKVGSYRIIFEWIDNKQPQIIRIEKVVKRDNRTYRPK